LLQKKMWQTDSPHLQIRLVGVHDYDGDGSPDLLLYTFNRLLSDRNPLAVERSNNQAFYSNLKFQVISHDFSKLLKNVSIAEAWGNWRGFSVRDFERPETAYYPFMALSDKITVFNFEN